MMGEWISVEDQLPWSEQDMWSEPVIALADNGEVFRLSCMGTYWQRRDSFIASGAEKITHWMPLLEPPK